jgi:hypothetical protein
MFLTLRARKETARLPHAVSKRKSGPFRDMLPHIGMSERLIQGRSFASRPFHDHAAEMCRFQFLK